MALLNGTRLALTAAAALALAPVGAAGQSLSQEEALALAFPQAELDRRTAYLDDGQLTEASRLAGPDVPVASAVVTYYVARRGGQIAGAAYFDAHRVRTMPEVLMIVVGPDGRISRIESVSFHEPPEYRAPGGWLGQFEGAAQGDLSRKGKIANLTGASLTAAAASAAARRVLALHRVIDPFGAGRP